MRKEELQKALEGKPFVVITDGRAYLVAGDEVREAAHGQFVDFPRRMAEAYFSVTAEEWTRIEQAASATTQAPPILPTTSAPQVDTRQWDEVAKDCFIARVEGGIYVRTPYDSKVVRRLRDLQARWDADAKEWWIRRPNESEIERLMRELEWRFGKP